MAATIPEVEIADDGNGACIGCKHDEADAIDTVYRHRVSAEFVVEPLMRSLAKQIEIEVAQNRRKAIGILQFDRVRAVAGAKAIAFAAIRQGAEEKSGVVNAGQRGLSAVLIDDAHLGRFRQVGANDLAVILTMPAKVVEGV